MHSFDNLGKAACVCLSPDARLVAVGITPSQYDVADPVDKPTLRCLDVASGRDLYPGLTKEMFGLFVPALAFSSDGKRLACACHSMANNGRRFYEDAYKVKVWSLPASSDTASSSAPTLVATIDLKPKSEALGVALGGGGGSVLAVRLRDGVLLWDLKKGAESRSAWYVVAINLIAIIVLPDAAFISP